KADFLMDRVMKHTRLATNQRAGLALGLERDERAAVGAFSRLEYPLAPCVVVVGDAEKLDFLRFLVAYDVDRGLDRALAPDLAVEIADQQMVGSGLAFEAVVELDRALDDVIRREGNAPYLLRLVADEADGASEPDAVGPASPEDGVQRLPRRPCTVEQAVKPVLPARPRRGIGAKPRKVILRIVQPEAVIRVLEQIRRRPCNGAGGLRRAPIG